MESEVKKVSVEFAGKELVIETGKVAKQAAGAVVVSWGDNKILGTLVLGGERDVPFLPLTVEFMERMGATGRIPGGFFKRESKPSPETILAARLVDRPIRPLFPEGWNRELQVILDPLSVNTDDAIIDVLGVIAASAAITISPVPFDGPVAAVRVGYVNDEVVFNPTQEQLEESKLNLVVAAKEDGIVMVEAGAKELPEDIVIDALLKAFEFLKPVVEVQKKLAEVAGKEKIEFRPEEDPDYIVSVVQEHADRMRELILEAKGKKDREEKLSNLKELVKEKLLEEAEAREEELSEAAFEKVWHEVEKKVVRKMILEEGVRPDGRKMDEIRPISIEVNLLPRSHGSCLFTRGETQALASVTLGTLKDAQIVDTMFGDVKKEYFMVHYNFPPFSTGEVKPMRGPSRREIGHGNLARRALEAVMPSIEKFPYTVRVVSDILESNGSSSMATVCAGCLALMDAGVPINKVVAGVAMGLVTDEDKSNVRILTDIMGMEDHCGDMDFKVAGTEDGITALQMDIKISGVSYEILKNALQQAKEARLYIIGLMKKVLEKPRSSLSEHAPKIITYQLENTKQVAELIGPGGKVIKEIIEKTGVEIEIDDQTGLVFIISQDEEKLKEALEWVKAVTSEIAVGEVLRGKVTKVVNFGVFVEVRPGKEGLVHISQLDDRRIVNIADFVKPGDEIVVKVVGVDSIGRLNLSRKEAIADTGQEDDLSGRTDGVVASRLSPAGSNDHFSDHRDRAKEDRHDEGRDMHAKAPRNSGRSEHREYRDHSHRTSHGPRRGDRRHKGPRR